MYLEWRVQELKEVRLDKTVEKRNSDAELQE
jgi:hypothetical protein